MTKTCARCKREKPAADFQRDGSQPSGLKSRCKECSRGRIRRKGESVRCPEVPLAKDGLDESCLDDLELGPAGLPPIAPVTPEEAHQAAPEGYAVKGVSTLYGADGSVVQQWVKTRQEDIDRMALLEQAVARIAEPFKGAADPVATPGVVDDDLLACIPMGDPHIGMYAWAEETGQDFNLEIAERNMVTAVDHLVDLAPPAGEALLIDLGDLFHADSSDNRTARSGHALDVDTRYSKVASVGIRTMRRCIDRCLERFRKTTVWVVPGNHDDNSAVMLAHCLANFYERDPRVHIETSPAAFLWYRFGECLIGSTHGHMTKPDRLPGVMAADRAEDWGQTKHRRFYCGHVHHKSVKEYPGVTVETLGTLAPRDAWAAGSGYRSEQDLQLDVWHRRWGLINRHVVGIRQIWNRQGAA